MISISEKVCYFYKTEDENAGKTDHKLKSKYCSLSLVVLLKVKMELIKV